MVRIQAPAQCQGRTQCLQTESNCAFSCHLLHRKLKLLGTWRLRRLSRDPATGSIPHAPPASQTFLPKQLLESIVFGASSLEVETRFRFLSPSGKLMRLRVPHAR